MTPKMSILGLLNYDAHLFDQLTIPDVVDRSTLVDTIIDEAAELIIRYPDPVIFKRMLNAWGVRRSFTWTKIAALLNLTYNPIHNYDRTERETITTTHESERNVTANTTQTNAQEGDVSQTGTIADITSRDVEGTDTGTIAMGKGTKETTSATGFNSAALQVTGEVAASGTDTDTRNLANTLSEDAHTTRTLNTNENTDITNTLTGSEQTVDGLTDETEHTRELRNMGNIGVTTTQQMMIQEMEMAKMLDLTKIIADEFVETFCVGVY